MAGHVRLQRKVTADYYPNWKSCPQRQRRLQVEVAARDLLADLIDGVLHALARGDDNAAVGVHPIGRDQLGTDVDQGRQRGAGDNPAPMPVHVVLKAHLPGSVGRRQPVEYQRGERKRVVWGKSVSVRVDLGGWSIIK